MAWARFDDKRHMNPKLLAAGLEANGLDANAITYCAANETDGFIPDAALMLIAAGARSPRKLARRLVDVGRWERDDDRGGHWVHDYLQYNDSKEKAEERRQVEREKKARQRSKGAASVDRDAQGQFMSRGDTNGSPAGTERGTPMGTPPGSPVGSPPLSRPDPTRSNQSRSEDRLGAPDVPPAAAETEDEDPEAKALVDRWVEVLGAEGRPRVRAEAEAVVGHLREHVDDWVIDERIGYCATLASPPRQARYLLSVVTTWAAERGQEIPPMNGRGGGRG